MAMKLVEQFKQELVCPITQEILEDPVVLVASGIAFSRQSILQHIMNEGRHARCPVTRQPIEFEGDMAFIPCTALKNIVEMLKDVKTKRIIKPKMRKPTPNDEIEMLKQDYNAVKKKIKAAMTKNRADKQKLETLSHHLSTLIKT